MSPYNNPTTIHAKDSLNGSEFENHDIQGHLDDQFGIFGDILDTTYLRVPPQMCQKLSLQLYVLSTANWKSFIGEKFINNAHQANLW